LLLLMRIQTFFAVAGRRQQWRLLVRVLLVFAFVAS
jgi:hypothetical protein